MKKEGNLNFIGIIEKEGEPSKIRVFEQFCEGLNGLHYFSHLIVLYWLHLRDNSKERKTLKVVPKRHSEAPEIGVFASRSPSRPNPIGLCVVELSEIDGCILLVNGLDAFEGSPIIDIKPYIPRSDSIPDAKSPRWTQLGPST